MSEFERIKLGDVGQILTGKTPLTKVSSYYDGTIHFVSPADLNNCDKNILHTAKTISNSGLQSIKGCILPKRTICVSCIGNLGYVGITTMECASNQQINSIIVDESRYDVDFIYYTIKHLWRYFKSQENQSTTISIINKSTFSNIEIYSPSLETQKGIASVLSSLDDKIAVNKKICENLEAQAQALFKHWFVDFAPFKDGKFVESELGLIPEGWRVGTLNQVTCNITDGVHNTVKDVANGGFYLLSCKNIKGGLITIGDHERTIDEETFIKLRKRTKLQKGDILLSSVGTIGEMLLVNDDLRNIEFQRSVAMIKPNRDVMTPHFLFYSLMNQKEKIIHSAHGAVQQCLFISDIANFITIVPPIQEINKFTNVVKILVDKKTCIENENNRLATLRDTLLPKLMSGQINVQL